MLAASVGWTPTQFWESTPRELTLAARALARRRKDEQRLTAWHAAIVGRCFGANVTMEDLLGEEPTEDIEAELLGAADPKDYLKRLREARERRERDG